ncbi:MAG: type 4a pilus biogenesis protein PilO [bacterium]
MKKEIILILGFSILLSGTGVFLAQKESANTLESEKDIKQLNSDLKYLNETKAVLEKQKNARDKIDVSSEKTNDKISQALPTDPGVQDLIAQINCIVSESGAAMKEFSLNPEEEKKPSVKEISAGEETEKKEEFKEMVFSITVSGMYYSIRTIADSIERNSRIMDLLSVKILADEESGGEDEDEGSSIKQLKADFKIKVYYMPNV